MPIPTYFSEADHWKDRSPDTAAHLEMADAILITVGLIILSTNVGVPTAPLHGYPGPNHPAFPVHLRHLPYPIFQCAHQRTQANNVLCVFPDYNKPTVYSPLTGPKPSTVLQPSPTTKPRMTFPTWGPRRSSVLGSAYAVFPYPPRSFPPLTGYKPSTALQPS